MRVPLVQSPQCLSICPCQIQTMGEGLFESNIFLDSGNAAQFESDFFPGWCQDSTGGGGVESRIRRTCPLLLHAFEDLG